MQADAGFCGSVHQPKSERCKNAKAAQKGAFKSKKAGVYAGWTEPDDLSMALEVRDFKRAGIVAYKSPQLAAEALKFANATPEPQAKVVVALPKHLRQPNALL